MNRDFKSQCAAMVFSVCRQEDNASENKVVLGIMGVGCALRFFYENGLIFEAAGCKLYLFDV
jgi:hypothetical protein